METLQAIILGTIQGASEFLPISSSGHLILAPWFFGWRDNGLSFSVALHFGTLIAVIAYFWKDWILIFKNQFINRQQTKINIKYGRNIFLILVVATIPGVLAGLFLEKIAETTFRHPLLVAFNLIFWGIILLIADKKTATVAKQKTNNESKTVKDINFTDGVLIGVAQALAIVPGTSRSGITISMGLFRKLDRVSAAHFSFLMLTPIVFGASLLKSKELINSFNLTMFWGILFSSLSGWLAIKFLITFVEKSSYKIFFWYRLILAIIIIITYFILLR